MKKLFLTTLIAAQGLFAVQGKTQAAQPEKNFGHKSVVIDVNSYRFKDCTGYSNPGVGLEWRLSNYFHVSGGLFQSNLFDAMDYHYPNDTTRMACFYAAGGFETNGKKKIGVGAEMGVISLPGDHIFAVPYVRFWPRDAQINAKVNIIPPCPKSPLTVGLQLRVALD